MSPSGFPDAVPFSVNHPGGFTLSAGQFPEIVVHGAPLLLESRLVGTPKIAAWAPCGRAQASNPANTASLILLTNSTPTSLE